jgi:hypothetical protein
MTPPVRVGLCSRAGRQRAALTSTVAGFVVVGLIFAARAISANRNHRAIFADGGHGPPSQDY